MKQTYTFDDVLLECNFSFVKSRKDVDIHTEFRGTTLQLPVISANMDSVTSPALSRAMLNSGAGACLHRFCSIEDNVKMLEDSSVDEGDYIARPWVSVGLGKLELERAVALDANNAKTFLVDVAHGANIEVVKQVKLLRDAIGVYPEIIVGNFANKTSILDFLYHLGSVKIDGFKVGIGSGSLCTTRIVTGCGSPALSSVIDCVASKYPIIADGGLRNSGDICKALAGGAKAVMLGKMLAGTSEAAGKEETAFEDDEVVGKHYRGSASRESYEVQNKVAAWRTPEGESTIIPYKGPVKDVLQQIEAGIRSAMSYVGATNLQEFKDHSQFVLVTANGVIESKAHAKL